MKSKTSLETYENNGVGNQLWPCFHAVYDSRCWAISLVERWLVSFGDVALDDLENPPHKKRGYGVRITL